MIDDATAATLRTRAREATAHAYVPYSRFPVGAALLTEDGTVVSGANIENASFGLTCCAERTAVFTAAAAGHRVVVAIAVTAPRVETVTPCGACRQVLNEFKPADRDMLVLLDGPDQAVMPLGDLLPRAFGPRDLDE